jgi:hypothetical protein
LEMAQQCHKLTFDKVEVHKQEVLGSIPKM